MGNCSTFDNILDHVYCFQIDEFFFPTISLAIKEKYHCDQFGTGINPFLNELILMYLPWVLKEY